LIELLEKSEALRESMEKYTTNVTISRKLHKNVLNTIKFRGHLLIPLKLVLY